jgi:CRISPR-associated protein Csa3
MNTSHIVFVGHHKERLMDSIKMLSNYPVGRIILVVGEQLSSGERRSRVLAEEMMDELGQIFEVEIVAIDKKDITRSSVQIVNLIRSEMDCGNDIIVNISGSLRTFAVSGYIAGSITGCKVITSIPQYDESGEETGVEEIVEIPTLPVCFLRDEQMKIVAAVEGGVNSLDELIIRLNPSIIKYSDDFYKERSRVSHHLKVLEDNGFIVKKRNGRQINVTLSELGNIMCNICS